MSTLVASEGLYLKKMEKRKMVMVMSNPLVPTPMNFIMSLIVDYSL